jgi:hypothetical protein
MSKELVGADEDTTWRKEEEESGGLEPWIFCPLECMLEADEDDPLF